MDQCAVFVDPDHYYRAVLVQIARDAGWRAISLATFEEARREVVERAPLRVVSNLRLGMFNGIQLAYVARLANPAACSVIYGTAADLVLAREVQRACAFYERQAFLPHSLIRYLTTALPEYDRRDVGTLDRRHTFRGGRRATDIERLHVQ